MCGRYLTPDEAALERAWDLHAPSGYRQSYNFAPSQLAPVLVASAAGADDEHAPDGAADGRFALELLTWGFQPHWAKRAWINARSETVFSSRAFAAAAKRHRCLVPALGWYEWQGKSPPRQPWLFHLDGFKPFAFAGIYTPARDSETGNFAILTTEAKGEMADIHSRMPVVIDESDQARWVAPELSQDDATEILEAHIVRFERYKVSSYVNKPANNDAACIAPI
jgi:putative SOS response-associated peptidase YedK